MEQIQQLEHLLVQSHIQAKSDRERSNTSNLLLIGKKDQNNDQAMLREWKINPKIRSSWIIDLGARIKIVVLVSIADSGNNAT